MATNTFRIAGNALESGKQFVDNLADAKALQKAFTKFFKSNQTIVEGRTTQSLVDGVDKVPFMDIPNGTALTFTPEELKNITPIIPD